MPLWSSPVLTAGNHTVKVRNTDLKNGSSHLVHSGGTAAYWAYTSQTLTGLSNGLYTVKAWVRDTAGHQLGSAPRPRPLRRGSALQRKHAGT